MSFQLLPPCHAIEFINDNWYELIQGADRQLKIGPVDQARITGFYYRNNNQGYIFKSTEAIDSLEVNNNRIVRTIKRPIENTLYYIQGDLRIASIPTATVLDFNTRIVSEEVVQSWNNNTTSWDNTPTIPQINHNQSTSTFPNTITGITSSTKPTILKSPEIQYTTENNEIKRVRFDDKST